MIETLRSVQFIGETQNQRRRRRSTRRHFPFTYFKRSVYHPRVNSIEGKGLSV